MEDTRSLPEDQLADFTRDTRVIVLSGLAIATGVISAFVAYALIWLINLITNLAFFQHLTSDFRSPSGNHLGLLVVLVPVIGGLLIGLMARFGSDRIRGHGIPEALEAILFGKSRMQPKVAVLKPVSSAISIGTGGPFGAEGPIIMTGGAFGSLFAQFFHLSSAERKTLLVAGAAGGMSAVFGTPVAAALLSVELLLFEWRPRSFIPVAVSSVIAYVIRVPLLGPAPIFGVVPHAAPGWNIMLAGVAAGVVAGLASGALTQLVYGFEDLFNRLPIHWMWWPAIGGLAVGIGGYFDPRIFGVGYDLIHGQLRGDAIGGTVAGLLILKALVWSFALGSGTSGGVLAPLLIIGGSLGALESHWMPQGDAGLWAMVGMTALVGGTMRSPLTAVIFTLELTHDMNTLPLLFVATIVAHTMTVLMMRRSILTEKVARRGFHVHREYTVDPFAMLRVSDAMDPVVQTVPAIMTVRELSERISRKDPEFTRHNALVAVDRDGGPVGIVTRGDLLRALDKNPEMLVIDAGSRNLIVADEDELLADAVDRLIRHDIGRMPVVRTDGEPRLVGYLGRVEILRARADRVDEEQVREAVLR